MRYQHYERKESFIFVGIHIVGIFRLVGIHDWIHDDHICSCQSFHPLPRPPPPLPPTPCGSILTGARVTAGDLAEITVSSHSCLPLAASGPPGRPGDRQAASGTEPAHIWHLADIAAQATRGCGVYCRPKNVPVEFHCRIRRAVEFL